VETTIGLARIAEFGARTLATSAEEIAAVTSLVQRTTGVDITVVSEITDDRRYVFRGIEKRVAAPVEAGTAIPYEASLCSTIHAGKSPNTVPDTRLVPDFWERWLALKAGLGVDWDILAFCTRDIHLPDGSRYGTLCLHHLEPRGFSPDEQALLEILARMLGQEIWRERSAAELSTTVAALAAAERRRVELAEELRHELRAPLQVIDGYAEGMLDGVLGRDDEVVQLVRRETSRAIRLLDDITELVRLEANAAGDKEPGTVSADASVTEMRDRFAPLAASVGIELATDVRAATVAMPRKRLEQLVVNLIRNALRAMQEGGGTRATLFVRPEAGSVAIGIEDDGPGLPEKQLARVFERFYRGGSESEAVNGSGLGLTIARRIVESSGGEIHAELVAPRGLRVVALLPLRYAAAGGDQPPAQPEQGLAAIDPDHGGGLADHHAAEGDTLENGPVGG